MPGSKKIFIALRLADPESRINAMDINSESLKRRVTQDE